MKPGALDVHLSVMLHGVRLDYAANAMAAAVFLKEHRDRHYVDAASVIPGSAEGLPRLPNERLYIEDPRGVRMTGKGVSPAVRKMLDEWNAETPRKLAVASPADAPTYLERADGTADVVDEDGFVEQGIDDLDKLEAIPVRPTSVVDTEIEGPRI
ncbi:hypothetical protein [Nocardia sp. Marseille-Q1738]